MESKQNAEMNKEELNKKMNFESIKDNREAFFKESEEFSGKEVEVILYNKGRSRLNWIMTES